MRHSVIWTAALALGLAGGLPADEGHTHDHGEQLGTVSFPVTCNAAARTGVERGVALLHSFQYDDADKAFADAAAADPTCAMAHWGTAMSLYHPVWAAANPSAAPTPAELKKGAEAVEKARAAGAKTDRERDYIAAVATFYTDAATLDHRARAVAFEKAMAGVAAKHPQDKEAAIFHAVALLGTAFPGDKTYAVEKKAATILNGILPDTPKHPGVAHYLIHSFDYPTLAELALPAARSYAKIAPSSPHALHMPSHIFTRLALWNESIDSNLASRAAARERMKRLSPAATSFEDLHAQDYLAYAYLQGGQDAKAKAVLDEVEAASSFDQPNFAAAYALAAVPARYALERRQWGEAAALTVRPPGFPWAKFSYAEALIWFARGVGAARGGNVAVAREAVDKLGAIQTSLAESKSGYWASQVEIQRQAAAGWLARAEKKDDEALALLRSAADLEDSTEKHPVTPGSVVPAREMLADLLLEQGRPADALKEFEASLKVAPGRFNGVFGAARAAEKAGQRDKARALYAQLVELGKAADPARAELKAAQAFLASASR
jgi:tetratricopeptide (TPR) repeat protein